MKRPRIRVWARFGCLGCSVSLALAVVLIVLAVIFGSIDGWGSYDIGTNTSYCSVWHWVHFSCQSGH